MEQSKKIKRSPKVGKTMKSYHLYLDDDLVAVAEAQPNKNRFFNAAIRKFINSMKKTRNYELRRIEKSVEKD